MPLNFRFAIISDLHIALPHTIWDSGDRFHLVELSIPALESVLASLQALELDFLLIPGDLTQHGEPENHAWLAKRLAQLPYPVYVVPGNHDIIEQQPTPQSIGADDFLAHYQLFGYADTNYPYYVRNVLPGVTLIGLNSIAFDQTGKQLPRGRLDAKQLNWLEETLATVTNRTHTDSTKDIVLVMLHHNVLEHLPGQAQHGMGQRYMLENASELLTLLEQARVPLIFTGHLHVQDIAHHQGIHHQNLYEITTGSLVSYPHPYRVLRFEQDDSGRSQLTVETERVSTVPGWNALQHLSREWMGDRSFHFMHRFLTLPPLSLSPAEATSLAPSLRYFWADIASGDPDFDFSHFPDPARQYLDPFSSGDRTTGQAIDNNTILMWDTPLGLTHLAQKNRKVE